MVKIVEHADYDASVKELVTDTLAELEEVGCSMGSTAFCIEDSTFYIKSGDGEWKKIG
jgi:hypothetical protein